MKNANTECYRCLFLRLPSPCFGGSSVGCSTGTTGACRRFAIAANTGRPASRHQDRTMMPGRRYLERLREDEPARIPHAATCNIRKFLTNVLKRLRVDLLWPSQKSRRARGLRGRIKDPRNTEVKSRRQCSGPGTSRSEASPHQPLGDRGSRPYPACYVQGTPVRRGAKSNKLPKRRWPGRSALRPICNPEGDLSK